MMTWFTDRHHAREHPGPYRDNEMPYVMKGYDDIHGLACLLDGNLGRFVEQMPTFGCHFGYNSFLDYGAEIMCSDLVAIHEIRAFSGSVERKFTDADWKWVLYQQQASFNNLSTLLDSKDAFEGSMAMVLKSDVKAAPEPSYSCAASKMPFCPHGRRNRPRRVHMLPALGSNTASLVSRKESMLYYTSWGHSCVNSLPSRSFSTGNEDWMLNKGQDMASRWINACSSPCVDRLCLASLLGDDRSTPLETKFFDILSPPADLTDLIPLREGGLGIIRPSSFESVSTISNRFNDKKIDFKVSDRKFLDAMDEDIEKLGKALCHAQTRARLAEKLAEQTLLENKRLEQLLIREAWTTFTYRQRALALELENGLLKLHPKFRPGILAGKDNTYIVRAAEPRITALWKLAGKQLPHQSRKVSHVFNSSQSKRSKPRKEVSLSSTLAFAFLLGLSIAGAGIAIVWSVGWIFF